MTQHPPLQPPPEPEGRALGAPTALRLIEHRRRMGWSQMELAVRAGVSVATVYAIEKGRTRPGRSVCARIAGALGVPSREVAELVTTV